MCRTTSSSSTSSTSPNSKAKAEILSAGPSSRFEALYVAPAWQRYGYRLLSLFSCAQFVTAAFIARTLILLEPKESRLKDVPRWQRDALGSALLVTAAAVAIGAYSFCVRRAASVALVRLARGEQGGREMLRVVPLTFPPVARLVALDSLAPLARLHTRQSRAQVTAPHLLLSTRVSAPSRLATFFERWHVTVRSRPTQFILDSRGTFVGDEGRLHALLARRGSQLA